MALCSSALVGRLRIEACTRISQVYAALFIPSAGDHLEIEITKRIVRDSILYCYVTQCDNTGSMCETIRQMSLEMSLEMSTTVNINDQQTKRCLRAR